MQRSKIEQLPKDVRDWLDAALIDGNFSGYAALANELQARGYDISRSGTHRYGSKLQESLETMRETTLAMQMMGNLCDDAADKSTGGLINLIQGSLFEAMQELRRSQRDNADADPEKRAALLAQIAKNAAALANASTKVKQHQQSLSAKADLLPGADGGSGLEICFEKPEAKDMVREKAEALVDRIFGKPENAPEGAEDGEVRQ